MSKSIVVSLNLTVRVNNHQVRGEDMELTTKVIRELTRAITTVAIIILGSIGLSFIISILN